MAENETNTAETPSETAVEEIPYNIRVEDAGPATKKIFVEIPQERVKEKIAEQFKELRQEAAIPGFRKGRAPQKLIEKKFSTDVKEQVRRSLISESYQKALDTNSLQVLGEPEFENPDAIKLDENSPLNYSFSVEIQPNIELPELKGLKVKKPKITVTEEHIDQAMKNLREQQGAIVPVEDRGVESGDFLTADVQVKVDDAVAHHQPDAQIVARPGRIAGLQIDDFDTQLAGAKGGDTRTITAKVPDSYPTENLRGKDVQIEVTLKDIKKMVPAELNQDFLDGLGFKDEKELRDALREQMDERIASDISTAMRRQVIDQLLAAVNIELPAKLSAKQTERVVNRRATELLMRGMPRERIQANVEKLAGGAAEEGARELKAFFILQKVAEKYEVDVSEMELNGRVAMLAMQQGQRPEKFKQEMSKDQNALTNLYVQMREEKAVDRVLEDAEIEEVEPTAQQQSAAGSETADAESSAT